MNAVVVHPGWAFAEQQAHLLGFRTVRVLGGGPKAAVAMVAAISGAFGKSPDAIISYSAWPAGIYGAVRSKIGNVPHIVYEHTSPASRLTEVYLAGSVIRSADVIACPHASYADDLFTLFGRRAVVVPNPVFTYGVKRTPVPRRVVCVGRIVEQKGFDVLTGLAERMPSFKFMLAGEGTPPGGVWHIGPLNHLSTIRLIATADVVLCPSRHESYSLVAHEAAALGVPVVASDVGAHRDLGATIVTDSDWEGAIRRVSGTTRQPISDGQDAFVKNMRHLIELAVSRRDIETGGTR